MNACAIAKLCPKLGHRLRPGPFRLEVEPQGRKRPEESHNLAEFGGRPIGGGRVYQRRRALGDLRNRQTERGAKQKIRRFAHLAGERLRLRRRALRQMKRDFSERERLWCRPRPDSRQCGKPLRLS